MPTSCRAERTKAIFKSQGVIPLSFLYVPSNVQRDTHPKTRWLPIYPSTPIIEEYSQVTWDASSHPKIHTLIAPRMFLIRHKDEDKSLRQFCFTDTSQPRASNITIRLSSSSIDRQVASSYNIKTVKAVYMLHKGSPQNYQLVGARFWVQKPRYLSDGTREMTLIWDCSLLYEDTKTPPPSRSSTRVNSHKYPRLKAEAASNDRIRIDIGKTCLKE